MVLPLKRWKSRASPGIAAGALIERARENPFIIQNAAEQPSKVVGRFLFSIDSSRIEVGGAGWSSPVARQAHNLKVVGSNPTPATNKAKYIKHL
jgi:hypothetical protein